MGRGNQSFDGSSGGAVACQRTSTELDDLGGCRLTTGRQLTRSESALCVL